MAVYGLLPDIIKDVGVKRLGRGLSYLADLDPGFFLDKPPGFSLRTEIRGDAIFAIHQVYVTKPVACARYESHRDYIDLQYVWKGSEAIAVAPVCWATTITPYDAKKDIAFYRYFPAAKLAMKPGVVAVLYPSDAHAPCLALGRPRAVVKTVVKVRI